MGTGSGAPASYSQDSVATGAVVAPSFTFGRQGVQTNAFLLQNNVVSDNTGIPVRTLNTTITYLSTSNDDVSTYDVEIYEHDGTTYTLLLTASVTAARGADYTPPSPVAVTTGKELACKIVNGAARDPVVVLFATGDVP